MVTGGAGFIGSTLVDRLLAEGCDVDAIDDLSTGALANLTDARAQRNRKFSFHRLDVRSPQLADLVAHRRPEVIFHLAAQLDVRVSVARPRFDAEVNVPDRSTCARPRWRPAPARSCSPGRAARSTASRSRSPCGRATRSDRSPPTASPRRPPATTSTTTGRCAGSSTPTWRWPTCTGRARTRTARRAAAPASPAAGARGAHPPPAALARP